MRTAILTALTFLAPLSGAFATEIKFPGQEFGFVPHKALYEVSLQSARSGSQIVNIKGNMYYEWNFECDAWNSKHRFNVLYEYADSPTMRITSDFSNFEQYDGSTLNFSVQRAQNGKQYEEIRGHAKSFRDKEGTATFIAPKGLEQTLPAETLYPMMHTLKVLEAAKAEKKFYNAIVFDGSDDDGPVEINAFIGKEIDGLENVNTKENKALDADLLNGKAQQIQLAFFPQNESEDQADYEMNLTLHHNSVISEMMIDYSDFSVSQKLIALEAIDPAQTLKTCHQ